MTQDVRAFVYCSLGKVISGSISESSVVDTGLVTVSGTVTLDGVYAPQRGQVVLLGYYKQGRIGAIGRRLRVLGYYSNTVTRTTEVSIGCYLSYHSETEPVPVVLNSQETDDNLNLSELEKLALLNPTSAASVFNYCCDVLGITRDPCPLTNQFFTDKFSISGNFVDLISDLLKSENYIGYLDASERLRYVYTPAPQSRGPVLTGDNIIDISPVQSNLVPADYVYSKVPYRQIKLDAVVDNDVITAAVAANKPKPDYGTIFLGVQQRSFPYTISGWDAEDIAARKEYRYENPITKTVEEAVISWLPRTDWSASYDAEGRLVERTEKIQGPWGYTYKQSNTIYRESFDREYQEEITYESNPLEHITEAIGFPEEIIKPLPREIAGITAGVRGWDRKTIRETSSTSTSVSTSYYEYALAIYTSDGSQAIKTYMEGYTNQAAIPTGVVFNMADNVVLSKSQHTYETKKPDFKINAGSSLTYPSKEVLDNQTTVLGKEADKEATYVTTTDSTVEILYSNQAVGGVVLEFTPPYLSDDQIVRVPNAGFRVIPSDAQIKARAYASVQNRMRLGQINGQSVVLPIEYVPSAPFNPVYLDFAGVVGQYRFDNVSIAFDNTGILFSADCLFWGGVGQ